MLTLYQVGKLNMVLRFLKCSCKPIFIPCALIYCSNNTFMDEGNQVGIILLMFLGTRRRDLTRAVMQRNQTAGCRGDYANLYSCKSLQALLCPKQHLSTRGGDLVQVNDIATVTLQRANGTSRGVCFCFWGHCSTLQRRQEHARVWDAPRAGA